MSRILCALSGIQYNCDYMPNSLKLTARESKHPMFDATYAQLTGLTVDWQEGRLSPTESYLLYLALFNTTELVEFRIPAIRTALTDSIVASNMAALVGIVDTIIYCGVERSKNKVLMPSYVISTDTKDLSNTQYWIANWKACYKEYMSGYKTSTQLEKLTQKESVLESLIKDRSKDVSQYAKQLSSWASLAGKFKEIDCIVADGSNNDRPILLSEYWERIIITCCKKTNIYEIHDADLDELIEYLEDNIDIASSGIYGHTLMSVLRACAKTKENYFNLGDLDIGDKGTIYKILDANASVEDANKVVLIDSAPLYEPRITEYPSRLAYLKARTKWDMSQRYKESDKLRAEMEASIINIVAPSQIEVTLTALKQFEVKS